VNHADERGRTKFSLEPNVGTKYGLIWHFFSGTKTKTKTRKKPEKTMVVIGFLVSCRKAPKINMVENGLTDHPAFLHWKKGQ
jgi:hypothetical protein